MAKSGDWLKTYHDITMVKFGINGYVSPQRDFEESLNEEYEQDFPVMETTKVPLGTEM